MKRHKHSDLIHAWAEGAEIQHRSPVDGKWRDIFSPSWGKTSEYRIKPPRIKVVYKRFLYNPTQPEVKVIYKELVNGTCFFNLTVDEDPYFIRWIDED